MYEPPIPPKPLAYKTESVEDSGLCYRPLPEPPCNGSFKDLSSVYDSYSSNSRELPPTPYSEEPFRCHDNGYRPDYSDGDAGGFNFFDQENEHVNDRELYQLGVPDQATALNSNYVGLAVHDLLSIPRHDGQNYVQNPMHHIDHSYSRDSLPEDPHYLAPLDTTDEDLYACIRRSSGSVVLTGSPYRDAAELQSTNSSSGYAYSTSSQASLADSEHVYTENRVTGFDASISSSRSALPSRPHLSIATAASGLHNASQVLGEIPPKRQGRFFDASILRSGAYNPYSTSAGLNKSKDFSRSNTTGDHLPRNHGPQTLNQSKAPTLVHARTSVNSIPRVPARESYDHTGRISALLPEIGKPLHKLSSSDYERCCEPWSRSSLYIWLSMLGITTKKEFLDSLTGLITHSVPTISETAGHSLASHLLQSFVQALEIHSYTASNESMLNAENSSLIEFLATSTTVGQGIIPSLTNNGCYSPRCHSTLNPQGVCYSKRCSRTIPLRSIVSPIVSGLRDGVDLKDWCSYWNLSKSDIDDILQSQKPNSIITEKEKDQEIQRQYRIHEMIYLESDYLADLRALIGIWKPAIMSANIPGVNSQFFDTVFGKIPALIELSAKGLDFGLRERQMMQGPAIHNIGDLLLNWLGKARPAYMEFAYAIAFAEREVRKFTTPTELIGKRSPLPMDTVLQSVVSNSPAVRKLDIWSFLGTTTRRMTKLPLVIQDIIKKTPDDNSDHGVLQKALIELELFVNDYNNQNGRAQDKIALMDLNANIQMHTRVRRDLDLLSSSRKLVLRQELERKSNNHMEWQRREIILLDNFLLMSSRNHDHQSRVFKVTKNPIPVDYLIAESYNEPAVLKSSILGIGKGTLTVTAPVSPSAQSFSQLPLISTKLGRKQTFEESMTSVDSRSSSQPSMSGSAKNKHVDTSTPLYPFTIKHAGKCVKSAQDVDEKEVESYTLYAKSSEDRQAWVEKINMTKAIRYARVAHLEPFSIRVWTSRNFGTYTGCNKTGAKISSVHNIVDAALPQHATQSSKPITMSKIVCAAAFQGGDGSECLMLGTEDGVYCLKKDSWRRVLALRNVTQIAVLKKFSTLIVLADKILVSYDLADVLSSEKESKPRRMPQRLSGSKEIGFFEVGTLSNRLLVIYKKKGAGHQSDFKALEPVVGKKADKKSSFFKKSAIGESSSFREFDNFFIPADCYGLQFMRTMVCIKCTRGFEGMSLETKQVITIPDLRSGAFRSLKSRLESSTPLGMFKIANGTFLCCFASCGVLVNGHGEPLPNSIIEWEGRPESACLIGDYVVAIGREFIEAWHIHKRALKQVITGEDIRMLPFSNVGGDFQDRINGGLFIAMARNGRQLVFEMTLKQF